MRQEEGEGREWWSGGVVVRRDGLESQPASSVFPTPIFCRGDAEEESGLGANSLLVNTERCFPILAPDSWLLTAGRVECWSGGSKRRPGTTGPFGISYANFFAERTRRRNQG
jgi:hypothetical protein